MLETILLGTFIVSFTSLFIAWIVFRLSSMRRIEAKVRAEGRNLTGWDGVGGRVVWYAMVIWLPIPHPNWMKNPLIDVEAVRSHATPRDRKLAAWFALSGWTFLASGLLLIWFF
jgi:hypothetical protein